jgi:hypothetical protein
MKGNSCRVHVFGPSGMTGRPLHLGDDQDYF